VAWRARPLTALLPAGAIWVAAQEAGLISYDDGGAPEHPIEVVLGVRALRGSLLWSEDDMTRALLSESLSAAVLQRYHVDMALRRSLGTKLGSLKDRIA
jgi:hypothetical protein